jgi:hypothetical protein
VPKAVTPAFWVHDEPQSRRCGVIAAWCSVAPAGRKREWPCNGRAHEFQAHGPCNAGAVTDLSGNVTKLVRGHLFFM